MALQLNIEINSTVHRYPMEVLPRSVYAAGVWYDGLFPAVEIPVGSLGADYFACAINEGREMAGTYQLDDDAGSARWWLSGTKLVTEDGQTLYLMLHDVRWLDSPNEDTSSLMFASDERGLPVITPGAGISPRWRPVADERVQAASPCESTQVCESAT